MPRRDIEDEVCIRILAPGAGGEELERRWWAISQPPPSVAFALQASIADALGGAADQAIRLLLRAVDPETEEAVEATEATLGESVALAVFRNARAGRALVPGGAPSRAARGCGPRGRDHEGRSPRRRD